MNSIYKYLISVVEPGDYWFIYCNNSVYINCEPGVQSEQLSVNIRISTNLKFRKLIELNITELHYSCPCIDKCRNICYPPKFLGDYLIFDRSGLLSVVDNDLYYKLAPLARFNHAYLYNLSVLKSTYGVLFWVKWKTNKIKFIDCDYANGLAIYDFDTAERILSICTDIPKVIFASKGEVSDMIKALVFMSNKVNIKNKIIKIYI